MKINFDWSFLTMLTMVFIVLKLCGVIAWSWWIVLLPAFIGIGFFVVIILIAYLLFIKRGVI